MKHLLGPLTTFSKRDRVIYFILFSKFFLVGNRGRGSIKSKNENASFCFYQFMTRLCIESIQFFEHTLSKLNMHSTKRTMFDKKYI